jgi:hypothetical protein
MKASSEENTTTTGSEEEDTTESEGEQKETTESASEEVNKTESQSEATSTDENETTPVDGPATTASTANQERTESESGQNGTQAEANGTSETATAEEALEAKRKAKTRLDELETLDAQDEVDIDDGLFTSIEHHIERGDLAFQSEEYANAESNFENAVEQSRAGLTNGYSAGAETLLNASATHLTTLKGHGYTDPEVALLETRLEEEREQLEEADDLESAKDSYESAKELHQEVQNLPAPWTIQLVNILTSAWIVFAAGGLMAVAGVVWWYRHSDDEDDVVEMH